MKNLQETIDNDLAAKFEALEERKRSTHDIDKLLKLIAASKRLE